MTSFPGLVLLILSALLSAAVTLWLSNHAGRIGLVHAPNHRSAHKRPTPVGGGLGISVAGALVGVVLWIETGWDTAGAVLLLSLLIASVGFRNDLREVPASVRLAVQILVCVGLLAMLEGLPPICLAPAFALEGLFLAVLFLFFGVWWINLFNFMDGIDGIAGSQALFMLIAGAGLAAWTHPSAVTGPAWVWMVCTAAATFGFLLLNWPPARIFMGDVGSTYLGFMILALALFTVRDGWLSYATWLILGALFVTDASVTLLTRMIRGERWYIAHSSHAYQRLARASRSHRAVTMWAVVINITWLMPWAWASHTWPDAAWLCVLAAYLPLAGGAVRVGAGQAGDLTSGGAA